MNRRALLLAASGAAALGAGLWWLLGRTEPGGPGGGSAGAGAGSGSGARPEVVGSAAPADAGTPYYYQCPNTSIYPIFSAAIPGDSSPTISNQDAADCFAWWELITLNWPTAPGAGFGDPGDLQPVQWQTWTTPEVLFPPNGGAPVDAGAGVAAARASDACAAEAGLDKARAKALPLLRTTSKFEPGGEVFGPGQIGEAAPANAPNWLASQNGKNVWYDVHVSPDEANFVIANRLYDANAQWSWVTGDGGVTLSDAGVVVGDGGHAFNLPQGQAGAGGAVGSIETKAAWMEVDDPANGKWQTYKLSPAIVVDPTTNKCRAVTLALVGLHILHKTKSQPSWVWATFEHVMNVPGSTLPDGGVPPDGGFNFHDPDCQPRTVSVQPGCLPDAGTGSAAVPVQVGCTPNVAPPYYLGPGCAPAPIQVTRTNPIDAVASRQTLAAWSAIRQRWPTSVWLNYQLVNVIWSSSATQPSGPVPVPLALNSMQPTSAVVANTTLETYVQTTTCTQCHVYATIARSTADCDPPWNSDVSFLMARASIPGGGCAEARKRPAARPRAGR